MNICEKLQQSDSSLKIVSVNKNVRRTHLIFKLLKTSIQIVWLGLGQRLTLSAGSQKSCQLHLNQPDYFFFLFS